MDWLDDKWIESSSNIIEAFYKYHRKFLPENPHDVWDEEEIGYFLFSFTLWSAQTKFKLKHKNQFLERASMYRKNIVALSDYSPNNEDFVAPESDTFDYSTYLKREQEYLSLLMSSSASLFKTILGSTMKPALRVFLGYACKRFVYSEKDLISIFSKWLNQKHMENMENLIFD